MADREFVGSEWLDFLNRMQIHYHIRIRENFRVTRHGKETRASGLFNDLNAGESKHLNGIYYVNNQMCYLSGSKVKDKNGKPELQITKPESTKKKSAARYTFLVMIYFLTRQR